MARGQRRNDVRVRLGRDVGLRPGRPGDQDVREHSIQDPSHGARAAR